jgi:5-hydroxyisourate hydrolase-like protein (transthyretin family)
MKWRRGTILAGTHLALFLATLLPASAQSAKVEGIAVNGANGEPIAGANIQLCAQPANGKMAVSICATAIADRDGRFAFSNSKPGHFYLAGDSLGYLRNTLVQNGKGGSDFDLHVGETRSFRLVLWPEVAIIGRIVDEDGKAIAGIDVSAIRDDSSLGRRYVSHYQYWGGPSEVATDRNGEFRIGELKAGRYYLEAFVAAWRKSGGELLKAGYIPAYYPDAPTLEAASVLCIGAGEQRKIEFGLKPRPTHAVRGRIEIPSGFKQEFEPLWGLRRDDGAYYGQFMEEEFDHRSGEWEIRDLPSGSYNLEIQTGIYDTDLVANKSFTITEADVKNLDLSMALRFSLRAKVHVPDGFHSRTPYSVLFNLEPNGPAEMTEAGQPLAKDGTVVFNRLQPGRYKLYLFSDDPVYIQSARFADQDAVDDGLSLYGPSNEVLDINLAIARSELDGVVDGDNGTPVAGADVKLIARGDDAPYVLRSVVSDAQGHFALKGVPPGNYKLVALKEAVRDREFGAFEFDQVKGQATPIQVRDASLSGISLKSTNLRYSSSSCSLSQLP